MFHMVVKYGDFIPLKHKAIEQVHTDFCKSIFKVKRSTTNKIMYGELGRAAFIVHITVELRHIG